MSIEIEVYPVVKENKGIEVGVTLFLITSSKSTVRFW